MRNKQLGDWLQAAQQQLLPISDTAGLDVQLIAAKVLNTNKTRVLAHPERELDQNELGRLDACLQRLRSGEALPYVLGEWEFYGRSFKLSHAVLIPRPETELLVETGIRWLKEHPHRRHIADVGTGSGCIGLTLALEIPTTNLIATDLSWEALQTARKNIQHHKQYNKVQLVQCNLLQPFHNVFDMICANLPYIPSNRLEKLDVARREPRLALDGGAHGIVLIEKLIRQAVERLSIGGLLLCEIDYSHEEAAKTIAARYLRGRIEVLRDLSAAPRVLSVERE